MLKNKTPRCKRGVEMGFTFCGRYDNVINTGGVKISPEIVEQKISHLINKRFIISSIPDARLGQKVILIIEGKAFDTESLMLEIKKLLSTYECPKEVCFVDEFELTGSGKVRRNSLLFPFY